MYLHKYVTSTTRRPVTEAEIAGCGDGDDRGSVKYSLSGVIGVPIWPDEGQRIHQDGSHFCIRLALSLHDTERGDTVPRRQLGPLLNWYGSAGVDTMHGR